MGGMFWLRRTCEKLIRAASGSGALLIVGLVYSLLICGRPVAPDGPTRLPQRDMEVSTEELLRDYQRLALYPPGSLPAPSPALRLEKLTGYSGQVTNADARIVGFSGEQLRRGSLVVFFDVEVHKPGNFTFDTILQTSGNDAIGVSTTRRQLAVGRHRLEFLFYGKLFHQPGVFEKNEAAGQSFLVPGILGRRSASPAELEALTAGRLPELPEGELGAWFKAYHTGSYRRDQFTNAGARNPELEEKIRALQSELRRDRR